MLKKIWILIFIVGFMLLTFISSTNDDLIIASTTGEIKNELVTNRYSTVYNSWILEGYSDAIGESGIAFPYDFDLDNSLNTLTNETNGYKDFLNSHGLSGSGDYVLEFNDQDLRSIDLDINVNKTGLYILGIDYYSQTTNISPIEIAVLVNDQILYYEAGQITLNTYWETSSEFAADRYQNEIMPIANQVYKWSNLFFKDTAGFYEYPLSFLLKEGSNKVTIQILNGDFLLGNFYYQEQLKYLSYETYLNQNSSSINSSDIMTLEAEAPSLKSSPHIRYTTNKKTNVTPFALNENKLNVVDGATYDTGGSALYYDLLVPKTGYYKVTIKYLQGTYINTRVYRTVKINGIVPFREALEVPFYAAKKWVNQTLTDSFDNELLFFLNEGKNTISFEVNVAPNKEIYENVSYVMSKINEISLDIKKITGNNLDIDRDWNILEYLPNLDSDLRSLASLLEDTYQKWHLLNKTNRDSQVASGLKMSFQWLYSLAEKPDEIPNNMQRLSTGSSSVSQKLSTIMPIIIESPLFIDKFFVHGENVVLPKANANFFVELFNSIRRFFGSFFIVNYAKEEGELEIWVNRSRQYVNLMQQMTDTIFSKETGIKVRISIMADENQLILANASNDQPDIAMGVATWRPYEFAIRNAVANMRDFEGFTEMKERFLPGSLVQLAYQEGIYGIPETTNFQLLFYRKDILDSINVPIPNTWNEVLSILPELQRFGMNFYIPLSNNSAFKSFDSTMPFINQFGGRIYEDDALSSALDDPKTIEAISFMTELYTTYSLPVEVGSFYNSFRYGQIPIGVGDFNMYIQLLHAAPEIAGLWGIAPAPGVENDLGVVDRSYVGAATSSMIFERSTMKNQAFQFLNWWTSSEVQINYSESLTTSMGPEYMWNTSNIEAFQDFSWNREHKNVFLEQWSWVSDVPKTPGTYILEREISNIWNKCVYNGANVRSAVEDSIVIIDKELVRKMYEFGYTDQNGVSLRAYILPTKEMILKWLSDSDEEE